MPGNIFEMAVLGCRSLVLVIIQPSSKQDKIVVRILSQKGVYKYEVILWHN